MKKSNFGNEWIKLCNIVILGTLSILLQYNRYQFLSEAFIPALIYVSFICVDTFSICLLSEFLNVGDDEIIDDEDDGDFTPSATGSHFENSGWSSRTRYVYVKLSNPACSACTVTALMFSVLYCWLDFHSMFIWGPVI